MKAVGVFPGTQKLELLEQDEPRLAGPNEVKLLILDVGVCGTDREISHFQYGVPPQHSEYLVIGHESLGEVIEVGAAVNGIKTTDLAVPMVRRPCPHDYCTACRSGRADFCYTGDYIERGIKEFHGFMTEVIVDDAQYIVPVPEELRDVAVLVEPLTVAEKALNQAEFAQKRLPWRSEPRNDEQRALVVGAGPIGLLGAMRLASAGFETHVFSLESPSSPEARIVRDVGAAYISSREDSMDELAVNLGNIDLIYEATGVPSVAFRLMNQLGENGVIVLTGVPAPAPPLEIEAARIMKNLVLKNQLVIGTVNAGRSDFESAVKSLRIFMKRWPAVVRSLISARHPVEDYADLLLRRPDGIKHVIAFDGNQ